MIRVLFFARLREQLGIERLERPWHQGLLSVADLRAELVREHGAEWEAALCGEQVIIARNHTVVEADAPLTDGDEVAFFPPVTGG